MEKITHTTTVTKETFRISPEEIFEALLKSNLIPKDMSLGNCRMFVRVPGGGDWSNTDLELESFDVPLIVEMEKTTYNT